MENERIWREKSSLLESESEYSESRSADTLSDDEDEPDNADLKGAGDNDTVAQRDVVDFSGVVVGGLAEFHEPIEGTIKSISLLGERNSGTRWIYGCVLVLCLRFWSSLITCDNVG